MRRELFILIFLFFVIGLFTPAFAQFLPEELDERAEWETFLQEAEIISSSKDFPEREAVTEPWTLVLEKDGVTRRAIWKNPEGRLKGFLDSWKCEIAAYRLDKLLRLNMVSPTVEKRFQGNKGSCQLMVENVIMLRTKKDEKIKTPSYRIEPLNRATYLQRAWDNLIANEDRNWGDILYTEDWRMILIDHSRAFRSSKKFKKALIFDEKSKGGPKLMKKLPNAFVEKLRALNFEVIREAAGEYLTDKEMEAVLVRRDLIIDWLDKRIKELGEDEVLY
ncbi:MAG: hypothetical protein PVH84_16140 [Candidatus Aminicenantes bacterium]